VGCFGNFPCFWNVLSLGKGIYSLVGGLLNINYLVG